MRGHSNAPKRLAGGLYLVNIHRHRARQQFVHSAQHFVVFIHHQLTAPYGGIIRELRQRGIQQAAEFQRCIHGFEVTQNMNFFGGIYLDARQQAQAVCVAAALYRRQIVRGVVVCHSNQLRARQLGQPGDVRGRHIVLGAGRKTGMHMQVIQQNPIPRFLSQSE